MELADMIVEGAAKANAELRAIIEAPMFEVFEREYKAWLLADATD